MAREEVKVVFIDTQYVQTDPVNFKSVVQRLTGKDSAGSSNVDAKLNSSLPTTHYGPPTGHTGGVSMPFYGNSMLEVSPVEYFWYHNLLG
ncbi:VQ motif-containing protein 1-like [Tripterygium wilfordii]|uniref:VQ motif-containing protein 1-like n=1 Tax=Tripterygium wilfordii TaxID=458696 RepID=A0A7J7CQK4_TRIWF|nr:uncharacterized protein LOC120014054 [Tripterygium wilfordii]KAF5736334.1 VQ motif-containing protein 1-like [Tripterygium wilfordii]